MTINIISEDEIKDRRKLTTNLQPCKECLFLIKLGIYRDEQRFYIAQGCNCGPINRVSEYYDDPQAARLDLSSFSWRS